MNDIKTYIDYKLSDIVVSSQLSEKILKQTAEGSMKRKKAGGLGFKGTVVAAAICLLLTCSITALASSVPLVNDWVYKLSPQFAQFLYPIQKFSEDQGIKLEVLSAANDDHSIVIYFSIQDMEGKGRVNEKLDLCDSEYVKGPCVFCTEFITYDEKTDTAYYKMYGSGGKGMFDQMVTFSFSSLMCNKVTYDWYDTKIDLSALLNREAETISLSEVDDTQDSAKILKPDVLNIPLGEDIDFVTISNIGFVDGKLHIQTKWTKSFDNHGELRILDEKGVTGDEGSGKVIPYDNIYFKTEEDVENQPDISTMHWESPKHIEFVYDIGSVEELEGYNLWGWFVKDGTFMDGSWKVNFRMSGIEQTDTLKISNLKGIGDSVEISSLGIYIEGYRGSCDEANIAIGLEDGNIVEYSGFSSDISEDGSSCELYTAFEAELDVNKITSVSLNQVNIYER